MSQKCHIAELKFTFQPTIGIGFEKSVPSDDHQQLARCCPTRMFRGLANLGRSRPSQDISEDPLMTLFTSKCNNVSNFCALLVTASLLAACSSSGSSNTSGNTGGAGSGTGGASQTSSTGGSASTNVGGSTAATETVVGNFSVALNPAIDTTGPFTSISGKVYTGKSLSDQIATVIAQDANCKVYQYSLQSCTNPACTTSQSCVATDVCQDNPVLAGVGDVTLTGIGPSTLKLAVVSKNYQYAGEITYPGFAEGDTITLSATGDYYSAFSVTARGVASIAFTETSYTLASGSPLALKWTAGSSSVGASVNIGLNISKHGGSVGYLECNVSDTGSLTIPAEQITALMNLGVSGFPQLTATRSTRSVATVSSGVVEFEVKALANPNLQIQGYCSCDNNSDCGTCSDTTKTVCNSVNKLCHAP
jgi:hypothetical protein